MSGSEEGIKAKMPFKKTRSGKYKSPSGRLYAPKQVRAYYATKGFNRKPKRNK